MIVEVAGLKETDSADGLLVALEVDMTVESIKGGATQLPDSSQIFMYTSFQSQNDPNKWETATCEVTYKRSENADELDEA